MVREATLLPYSDVSNVTWLAEDNKHIYGGVEALMEGQRESFQLQC